MKKMFALVSLVFSFSFAYSQCPPHLPDQKEFPCEIFQTGEFSNFDSLFICNESLSWNEKENIFSGIAYRSNKVYWLRATIRIAPDCKKWSVINLKKKRNKLSECKYFTYSRTLNSELINACKSERSGLQVEISGGKYITIIAYYSKSGEAKPPYFSDAQAIAYA